VLPVINNSNAWGSGRVINSLDWSSSIIQIKGANLVKIPCRWQTIGTQCGMGARESAKTLTEGFEDRFWEDVVTVKKVILADESENHSDLGGKRGYEASGGSFKGG